MTRYEIEGRDVSTPVHIRRAVVSSAMFLVPARAAQEVVDYSGFRVAEPVPGRAVCTLACIRYDDGDLGQYNEFGVVFPVRGWHAFVHWLPVDQTFTLEAGRRIWGFPKSLAEIRLAEGGGVRRCTVSQDGDLAVELAIATGGVPLPARPSRPVPARACTYADGVRRLIPWEVVQDGARVRPGGAQLHLGTHPVADQLRALGLPRRAMVSMTVEHASMVFEDARSLVPSFAG
jgi:Acetoacetate decarboxylase (ADC)